MPDTDTITTILEGRQGGQEYAELFGFPPRLFVGVELTALERFKAGRFDEAEALLRGVTTADTRRYYPQLLLAEILWKTGRPVEALEAIERAFALEPANISVRLKLGELLVLNGASERAREHLEHVVADAGPGSVHHLRATMILQRLGR